MSIKKIERTDPEAKSADVVAENVARLRELFPELITEGEAGVSVNVDVLKQLVGDKTVTDAEEKYGLNWHGKRAARQLALTPSLGTLRPCPNESVDWDTTQNLMIEGDNLEVLKLLQKSYAGKVKLIYIDPPYNTGKDFVYPDNFQDNIRNYLELTGQVEGGARISSNTEASGRFHTDWLNMMYPRLRIAKSLLREDGMILISIDDGEAANVHLLMDELFGAENFVANVVWQKKYGPKSDARYFSESHDFVAVYCRSKQHCTVNRLPRSSKQNDRYKSLDNDPRGPWKPDNVLRNEARDYAIFPVKLPSGREVMPPPGTSWRFTREKFDELIADNRIWFGKSGDSRPAYKRFLSDVSGSIPAETIWFHTDAGHNDAASKEVRTLFAGELPFSSPKPVRLLSRVLGVGSSDSTEDIVLDFFAGSGTTGHAVIAQNAADGGKRRYVLVQLPEPLDPGNKDQKTAADFCDKLKKPRNIAELTKERLRRAGKKIRDENPMFKGDTGFRVFKLDSSNIKAWDPATDNLEKDLTEQIDHLKHDRSEQDILYEMLLKLGLDLCVPMETRAIAGKQVHSIGGGVLMACLDKTIKRNEAEKLALGMAEWHKKLNPAGETTCVFRDAAFADDVAKTNVAAILNQHGITTVRSI